MNTQADSELFLELYIYDLEKDISRRLTTFRPTQEFIRIMPYFDQYQRSSTLWSADSETIAYASLSENGLGQIFIVHADGDGVPRRIAPGQIAYWAQHTR
jgi:Tol biopolymer transport system component